MPDASERPSRAAPALRPRDAATLILVDRSRKKPRVLMGKRHGGLVFLAGKYVFPGGRVEAVDRRMTVAGALPQRSEDALAARVAGRSAMLGRSLALAAIRETYEETGLVVGTREYGPPESTPDGPWGVFAEEGVMPDLEALHLLARAITPPKRPRRYDTRFFVADRKAVAAERAGIVGPDAELTEIAWVAIDDARGLDLPRITRAVLDDLEEAARLDFKPFRPIPFYFDRHGKHVRELL
ncbi:NUDIX hydrolase [Methylobacterium sp. C25]|uniref:NUDIX hydrolase n=1 Tax=Methylobacterium sp. C25 TaxID=2721622 RepID=UPI001F407482|nr:NUDIX hydrolase [Methylobacterium sp. C25]MCE4225666.1 NUDIX hydrolase [Methylobacterium sp. C25]